jgi:hypothetical protein
MFKRVGNIAVARTNRSTSSVQNRRWRNIHRTTATSAATASAATAAAASTASPGFCHVALWVVCCGSDCGVVVCLNVGCWWKGEIGLS